MFGLEDLDAILPTSIAAIFRGVQVHKGFLSQLENVAITPIVPQFDIVAILNHKLNGTIPDKVCSSGCIKTP